MMLCYAENEGLPCPADAYLDRHLTLPRYTPFAQLFISPAVNLSSLLYQPTVEKMASIDTSPLNYSNSGPTLIITCSMLAFITTIVFALRFWSRRLTRQPFGLDDYLCLAALIIQHGLLAAAGVMVVQGGLGRDIRITATEDPNSVVILFQVCILPTVAIKWLLME
jgi:hypothetical protein